MKRAFLMPLAAALICALTPFTAEAATVSAPEIGNVTVTSVEDDMDAERVAYLVNVKRRANGVPAVKILPVLNKIAKIRAEEISRKFDHVRPDGTGVRELIEQNKIQWKNIGENLAMGQPTPDSAVDSWMNSQKHRENMLNSAYQYIGVASYTVNGTHHWVQIFLGSSASNNDAYAPRNFGDVNDDSVIDGVDATIVLTDYAKRSVGAQATLDKVHLDIADMTRDGIVNAIDATSILTVYAHNSVR